MSRLSERLEAPRVVLDRYGNRARPAVELLVPDKRLVVARRRIIDPKAIGFGAAPASAVQAGGAPPPAISFVDSNATSSASATPPGDGGASDVIIIGIAFNDDPTPLLPESGWNDIANVQSGSGAALHAGWRPHNGAEGSYTWTNAAAVIYLVYSGVDLADPIGDFDTSNTNTTTWTCPGKTLVSVDPWVIWAGCAAGNTCGTPGGLTSREIVDPFSMGEGNAGDTNGPVSSFSSTTGSLGASERAVGISIELKRAA